MVKILFLIAPLIILCSSIHGQELSDAPKAQEVLEAFFEKIGGVERWDSLKTRIEHSTELRANQPTSNLLFTTNYFMYPNFNVKKKQSFLKGKSLLVFTLECSWYYSEILSSILFFDYEIVKPTDRFPKSEFMEMFNLQTKKKVAQDDLHYIVKLIDSRKKDGIQTLYFDKETLLLQKRVFIEKNDVLWTYTYEKYIEKRGYVEPYEIVLYSNSEQYLSRSIDDIKYNENIDSVLFISPIPCGEPETHVEVDASLLINY